MLNLGANEQLYLSLWDGFWAPPEERSEQDFIERCRNMSLDEKVEKSVTLLSHMNSVRREGVPFILNFSGGKDSLCCLTLLRKITDDVECCYADGGFELPQTLEYVKRKCGELGVRLHVARAGEVKLTHQKNSPIAHCQTLRDFVLHYKCFPTAGRRWCSTWLKQRLMKAYWRQIYPPEVMLFKVVGVRVFESKIREWKYGKSKHYRRHIAWGNRFLRYDREHIPSVLVYPILDWTSEDVIEYLKKEKIKVHEGYKLFGISGCKWCPVHKKETFEQILSVYPDIYDDIIELEEIINRPAVENKYFLWKIKRRIKGG